MTEQEWLESADPACMLNALEPMTFSGRKFRLFACACTRHIWHLLSDNRSREAVILAEKLAEGELTRLQVADSSARDDAQAATRKCETNGARAARKTLLRSAKIAANDTAWLAACAQSVNTDVKQRHVSRGEAQAVQCSLLRCIFGNPLRPITFDPAWLTTSVKQLAESIYAEKAFDRLPILADALSDAGCTNGDILNHCRQSGVHVRGCWALDMILGKE